MVTKNTNATGSWANYIQKILVKYGVGQLWENDQVIFNIDGKGNLEAKSIKEQKFLSKMD